MNQGLPVSTTSENEVCKIEQPTLRGPPHPYRNSPRNPSGAETVNDMVIEMEDPRCKIVAIEMDESRCRNSVNGVVIEIEDFRCKSLIDRVVLEVEDARCNRMAIKMEDPRCKSLLMAW